MIAAEVMVPCISFAQSCRLDWAAVSAVGGWAAAIATFLAVLLPYTLSRRKEKMMQELAMFELSSLVESLASQALIAESMVKKIAMDKAWFDAEHWHYLKLPQLVHAIPPTVEAKDLLLQLSDLRNGLASWNAIVEQFERIGGEVEGNARTALLADLMYRIEQLRALVIEVGMRLRLAKG